MTYSKILAITPAVHYARSFNTQAVTIDGAHLAAVRGLTHQEVPTRVR